MVTWISCNFHCFAFLESYTAQLNNLLFFPTPDKRADYSCHLTPVFLSLGCCLSTYGVSSSSSSSPAVSCTTCLNSKGGTPSLSVSVSEWVELTDKLNCRLFYGRLDCLAKRLSCLLCTIVLCGVIKSKFWPHSPCIASVELKMERIQLEEEEDWECETGGR